MRNPSPTDFAESLNRHTVEVLVGIENVLIAILASNERLNEVLDKTLNILVSAGLNTSPNVTVGHTVGIIPELLFRNDTAPVLTINVSNLDPAQPCWIGLQTVSTNNGKVIQPRNNENFALPMGTSLYAITDVGTINVVVSNLNSLYDILRQAGMGGVR